jgi:uncharacterized protein (DUF2237 family)
MLLLSCARSDAKREPSTSAVAAEAGGGACALPSAPVISRASDKNIDGAPLAICSNAPLTGFFRDGRCSTGADDLGVHVVCAQVTDEFLQFSKARGNDLVTPRGSFAGLKGGDRWCLCAARWREAEEAGVAPPVVIEATHEAAKSIVDEKRLHAHALAEH